MNYSATITAGADVLHLEIRMTGVDADETINNLRISVNGNLPSDAMGNRALFDDYIADYSKVRPGKYRHELYASCGGALIVI